MKKIAIFTLFIILLNIEVKAQNEVSILYFNDAHEIMPVKTERGTKGGVARLKALVDSIKSQKQSIVVFGGDLAGGTLFGKVYKGHPMIEVFNKIPVDIANFGQHEFDFGLKNTLSLVRNSKFSWLTSNLEHLDNRPLFGLTAYKIVNKGGVKIAFFGLTDKINTTSQGEDLKQLDLLKATEKVLVQIKKMSPDYIVAITQANMDLDKKILEAFPAIDLILTEEISEKLNRIESIYNQYIVAPIGNMGSVAEINLKKRNQKVVSDFKIHYLGDNQKSDKALDALAKKYQNKLEKDLSEKISFSQNGVERGQNYIKQESLLGDLIADAYKNYYKADIGMVNSGGIRKESLPSGVITKKDVYAILPFNGKIRLVRLTGKEIIKLLEIGLINRRLGGDLLQVSGLRYFIKKSADNGTLSLDKVFFGDKEINENKYYTVALPDFVAKGGGAFNPIEKNKMIDTLDKPNLDTTIFSWYLKQFKNVEASTPNRIMINAN